LLLLADIAALYQPSIDKMVNVTYPMHDNS
jgi:hypothetical protein